jgi:putative transposase
MARRRLSSPPTYVFRRAVKAPGYFRAEQAAIKCLHLVTRSLDPTGTGRTRRTMRWKPALNAFAITFAGRFPAVLPNFGPPNYAL